MKSIILVAFAVVAIAAAVPVENVEPVKTIRAEFEQQPDGSYVNSFETENHILVQETGEVKEVLDENNKPQKVVVVRGSYAYVNPEGNQESINYFADETGYHADGPSVPKVPVPARR